MTDHTAPDSDALETLPAHFHGANTLFVLSHAAPDGDAVGSAIALALGLQALGKRAVAVFSELPARYDFLGQGPARGVCRLVDPVAPETAQLFATADLGVLVDASEPSRVGDFEAAFLQASCPKVCIDHHLSERVSLYVAHVIDPKSASSGELVLRLLDLLEAPLDRTIAEALFVALATDTGWFRYTNTTPAVLETAARLLGYGLEPDRIFRRIYERVSAARLKLQGRVLAEARVELKGDLVCSCVDNALLGESGVAPSELEGVIDPLRTVEGSEVAALLTEREPGEWKISLRSRGRVDVEAVARSLGGGGHAMAAGARASGTREAVLEVLIKEVQAAILSTREGSRRP